MKITPKTEYLNEVHNKWLPVPPHWVGLDSSEVQHKLYFTVTSPDECTYRFKPASVISSGVIKF
jgi:hypothetical protein